MILLRAWPIGAWLVLVASSPVRAEGPAQARPGPREAAAAPDAFLPVRADPVVQRPRDAGLKPSVSSQSVTRWLGDGLVVFAASLLFLLLLLRRQLAASPAWVRRALVAVVAVGAGLRWLRSPVNIMEAWPWRRVNPLAAAIFEGPAIEALGAAGFGTVFLVDVVSDANLAVAVLTPLLLFAHARYVLKDDRVAVAAALLVALLPLHLRFSRSDAGHVQAIATSSLTFVVLYGALTDASRRWRLACLLLLPVVSWVTYRVRPENITYVGLDLAGIYVVARSGVPRRRVAVAVLLVIAAAVFTYVTHLRTAYGQNVDDGLSLETLRRTWMIVLDVGGRNTLLNPRMTPPVLLAAAVLGAVALVKRGEQLRALFLVGWLGAFFIVNSYVYGPTPEMQARYHLNLVTPFVFLAAASAPVVLAWRRAARGAVLVVVALSPLFHDAFVTDTAFAEMEEFSLLSTHDGRGTEGCGFLEYVPAGEDSRFRRFRTRRVAGVRSREGGVTVWDGVRPPPVMQPGACYVALDGLLCRTHPLADGADACARWFGPLAPTVLAEVTTEPRFYDSVALGALRRRDLDGGRMLVADAPSFHYRLLRIDVPAAPAVPAPEESP